MAIDYKKYPLGPQEEPWMDMSSRDHLINDMLNKAGQMTPEKLKQFADLAGRAVAPPTPKEVTKHAVDATYNVSPEHINPLRSFEEFTSEAFGFMAGFKDVCDWCNAQAAMINATYAKDPVRLRLHMTVLIAGFRALFKGEGM